VQKTCDPFGMSVVFYDVRNFVVKVSKVQKLFVIHSEGCLPWHLATTDVWHDGGTISLKDRAHKPYLSHASPISGVCTQSNHLLCLRIKWTSCWMDQNEKLIKAHESSLKAHWSSLKVRKAHKRSKGDCIHHHAHIAVECNWNLQPASLQPPSFLVGRCLWYKVQ